jgi:hypothetical protein
VNRGRILFENGSDTFIAAEHELERVVREALREIERRKRKPFHAGWTYVEVCPSCEGKACGNVACPLRPQFT